MSVLKTGGQANLSFSKSRIWGWVLFFLLLLANSYIIWIIAKHHDVDTEPPPHDLTREAVQKACATELQTGTYRFSQKFVLSIPCTEVAQAEADWEAFLFRQNAPVTGANFSFKVNGTPRSGTITIAANDYQPTVADPDKCKAEIMVDVDFVVPAAPQGSALKLVGFLNEHVQHQGWSIGNAIPGNAATNCFAGAQSRTWNFFECMNNSPTHNSDHVSIMEVPLCS